jgi:diguanylate cyclase (GGDEF)-like protein/PAS domain S-box-containing protein
MHSRVRTLPKKSARSFDKARLNQPFMWLVIAAGAAVSVWSALNFDRGQMDVRFVLLASVTIIFGSRIGVQIPRVKSEITVSDTFVFLVLLLYAGPPAVLLAGAEAFCSSMRFAGKWRTRFFNASLLALSTFVTASVLRLAFGPIGAFGRNGYSDRWVACLFVMALVQYGVNSGLAALRESLRRNEPFTEVWRKHFLWTSITYFAGASAAGVISGLLQELGLYAFFVAVPIIGIIYATYRTYRRNIAEAEQHAMEQERVSKALMESEEHFRNAFDHAAGMALISPIGHWLQVNNSLCQMLGYTEDQLLKKNFQELTHPDDLPDDLVHIYRVLEGKTKIDQREKRYLHSSGQSIWVLQSASLVTDSNREAQHLILQIQDITERKQAEARVHHAAYHDALTGLPNRSLLSDRLSLAIARGKRSKHQFAVLFLDLDRFKFVNDSLGHTLGDQLLVEVSRRVERCMRKMDTVARLGGDEFAVLLDGISGPHDAIHIAERILESVSRPCDLSGHEIVTSGSIGIAYSQTGYEKPEDILRDADTAMYRAKSNGKARYEVFDRGMHSYAVEMLTLERDLRRAIEQEEIEVYYQPIVSLADNRITGLEALARWLHPDRGFISPSDFIPIAEETGMILPLGLHVLRKACAQVREWQRGGLHEHLGVSVNLSGKQFSNQRLVEETKRVLDETQLNPAFLHLEITETVIMENAATATDMLQRLKDIGIQLSIDDFGTGYSSLSYLHQFPFDILKVDRSFVSRMTFDRNSKSIVETILILAKKLNKRVVAEGIETAEQLAQLKEINCDFGQGFLFSQPLPAAEIVRLLNLQDQNNSGYDAPLDAVITKATDVDTYAM